MLILLIDVRLFKILQICIGYALFNYQSSVFKLFKFKKYI